MSTRWRKTVKEGTILNFCVTVKWSTKFWDLKDFLHANTVQWKFIRLFRVRWKWNRRELLFGAMLLHYLHRTGLFFSKNFYSTDKKLNYFTIMPEKRLAEEKGVFRINHYYLKDTSNKCLKNKINISTFINIFQAIVAPLCYNPSQSGIKKILWNP